MIEEFELAFVEFKSGTRKALCDFFRQPFELRTNINVLFTTFLVPINIGLHVPEQLMCEEW
ncbi:unnamed protein product [Rodentolepis nana]|uniref:Uncharacterized protein n=1 Tax=Rodentolepis nana TaxID=102285 RepID=A0A3P7S3M7_RODNA|nr:unnamed protein product [Rodentolepis nana]